MQKKSSLPFLIPCILSLVFWVGCGKDEIKVYLVEKEPTSPDSDAGPELPPPSVTEHLEWTVPSGWKEKAPSAMRYGSFTISGKGGSEADLSVISLAGDAGGVLANINRWREQLALPPITEALLPKNHTQLEVLGAKVTLVDFTSPADGKKPNTRMLAAILPHGPSTWFFKMTGDAALVEAQKSSFTQFLRTLRFTGTSASPAVATEARVPPPSTSSNTQGLNWTVPDGWKEMPPSGMRKGSFAVSGNQNMQADVSIVSLPGDAGGFLSNINRWRGQISLPPLTQTELSKLTTYLEVRGEQVALIDMISPSVLEQKQHQTRILGAIMVKGDQCWFFKMMGDDALVKSQKQAFTKFVQSAEIPGG